MHDRAAKNRLYDGFTILGKALASGRRLEILDILMQGARSVEEIASQIDQSLANTSQHLQVLAESRLVSSQRRGRYIEYSIAAGATDLVHAIRRFGIDQIDAIDELTTDYLGPRGDIEWITRAEMRRRLRQGSIVLIDVRPQKDFAASHIPGALSIPVDQLADRADQEVSKGRDVVVYCRGPFCALGDAAVRLLRSKAIRAFRLEDGFPEWQRDELAG
jgi:rhodanese-related sulfurtransferase